MSNKLSATAAANAKEVIHPLTEKDELAMAAMRAELAPFKGAMTGPDARGPFDETMERTRGKDEIQYEGEVIGGVPGIWCRPPVARPNAAILYLHGGAYVLGSAKAYRFLGSQFASRTSTSVFIPDYRLAPEHVFPAAISDALAAYRGLAAGGVETIAVVGDSAGGGLALVVLSAARADTTSGTLPIAAIAMSPWTDLAVTGPSVEICADTDPLLTREMLLTTAKAYLVGHDPRDPLASALYARLEGLPPIQIHVGTDEILLDDALRYTRRARAANVDAVVHVWEGMPHVFAANVGVLDAAEDAFRTMADFLSAQIDYGATRRASARPGRP